MNVKPQASEFSDTALLHARTRVVEKMITVISLLADSDLVDPLERVLAGGVDSIARYASAILQRAGIGSMDAVDRVRVAEETVAVLDRLAGVPLGIEDELLRRIGVPVPSRMLH